MTKNVAFSRKNRKKSKKNSITEDFSLVFEFLALVVELFFTIINPFKWFDN